MSATVTRLDDHRPSLLARARSAMRAWWNGLTDLPELPDTLPLSIYSETTVARRQKPLNWPLCKGDTFDEYLLDIARLRGLTVRTRQGDRVWLDKEVDPEAMPGELRGRIELADGCDGALQNHILHWMDDGSFAVHEHVWDLVSVETASCIHCDRHDIDMDYDMSWDFVSVDRERGLGVCSRCAGGEAA
jgi:hypothetical protein